MVSNKCSSLSELWQIARNYINVQAHVASENQRVKSTFVQKSTKAKGECSPRDMVGKSART